MCIWSAVVPLHCGIVVSWVDKNGLAWSLLLHLNVHAVLTRSAGFLSTRERVCRCGVLFKVEDSFMSPSGNVPDDVGFCNCWTKIKSLGRLRTNYVLRRSCGWESVPNWICQHQRDLVDVCLWHRKAFISREPFEWMRTSFGMASCAAASFKNGTGCVDVVKKKILGSFHKKKSGLAKVGEETFFSHSHSHCRWIRIDVCQVPVGQTAFLGQTPPVCWVSRLNISQKSALSHHIWGKHRARKRAFLHNPVSEMLVL